MRLPFYWVDAFSAVPFAGNPAGVVPLPAWIPDSLMQRIASQHGLAETAFFVPLQLGGSKHPPRYQLRWFTPAVEVDLCGHATLASGHVLLREQVLPDDVVVFESRSGPLTVTRRDDKLELDFPALPPAAEDDPAIRIAVERALGTKPQWQGRSQFDRFAVLDRADAVQALRPDPALIAAAGGRGLIVTAPGGTSCDFVSRFFAPQSGVPEDPVTGSAHCTLAPYWASRLGRTRLHARQISSRGGELWCDVVAGAEVNGSRVKIAGQTALYLRGEISLPG